MLPAAVEAALHPDLERLAVAYQIGEVEAVLVLLLAPSGCVGALRVVGGRVVDAEVGRA